MTSQQLDIFLRLSASLNFRKVAEDLYTTQPTISRQLRLLEEELGMELFVRSNKEVRLTPEGAIMLEYVRRALDELSKGQQTARRHMNNPAGRLNIGMPESMNSELVTSGAVAFLCENYPEIELSLKKYSFSGLREKLSDGALDIVFTPDFDIKNYTDIVSNEFSRVCWGFIVNSSSPLADSDKINPDDFSGETFILPNETDSPGRKDDLVMLLNQLGIHAGNIIFAANAESANIKVAANQGIGISDTGSLAPSQKNLKFIPAPENVNTMKISYVWKKNNFNPALALFTNILMRLSGPDL